MAFPELLALSAAGNIVLGVAYLYAKHKLHRAYFILIEVADGRAEVQRHGHGAISIRSKIVSKA